MAENKLYTWGAGQYGRLGLGDEEDHGDAKQIVALKKKPIVAVGSGAFHSCAVTGDGQLFSWGLGGFGRLGHGDRLKKVSPKIVASLCGREVRSLACGYLHTLCTTNTGQLFSWGGNRHGQLGHGSSTSELLPRQVAMFESSKIKAIACGWFHTACITEEGHLYTWGCGAFGRLGHGDRETHSKPKAVAALSGGVKSVAMGYTHSAAVANDGTVHTWGGNTHGQLGQGESESPLGLVPKQVAALAEAVVEVSAGGNHTVAITGDGSIYTWGMNNVGQLGHGNRKDLNTPKKVDGAPKVKKVACGYEFSSAITNDGLLLKWGDMDYERTSQKPSDSPVAVPGFNQCKDLSCGDYHILVTTL